MSKGRSFFIFSLPVIFFIGLFLTSCKEGGQVIPKPDEFTHIYEAGENTLIRAIAQTFKEKGWGNVTIDPGKKQVESDYLIQDGWRSKSIAWVKKINWKECEVTLSIVTEKKTSTGWEMRRLLEKKQYDIFFDAIDLQVYQEMYKIK